MGGASLDDAAAAGDAPDATAARRVNELALRWATSSQAATTGGGSADAAGGPGIGGGGGGGALLTFGDDRELQDDPAGPFGNKGGKYVESRITLETAPLAEEAEDDEEADHGGEATGGAGAGADRRLRLKVTSPTITTPLSGVPEAFLASHYMKVLCPVVGGGLGACEADSS